MPDFDQDIYDALDDEESTQSGRRAIQPDPQLLEKQEMAMQVKREQAQAYKAELLSRLNPDQARAAGMGHESCLVLAGAGSGKTSLLTARVAYLRADGMETKNIMTVTFTNKAAQEMRNRLGKILPRRDVEDLWTGTFHSLCNKILRECHKEAGLPKNFGILDTDGQETLVRTIMRDTGLLPTKAERDSRKKAEISAQQAALALDPLAQVANSASDASTEDDGAEDEDRRLKPSEVVSWINKRKEFGITPDEVEPKSLDEETMLGVFRGYKEQCQAQGLLDFSDLLYRCVNLLERDTFIRGRYQGIFRAILIDEFQDTNDIQYRWLQLLKGPKAFVMAVGDDDQSIYAFRGANPENMIRFVNEMTVSPSAPQGTIIKLEQNYRSLPYILDAANGVIDRNTNRIGKTLWSGKTDGKERIDIVEFENGYIEAKDVAAQIHELIRIQGVPPNEVAVLYRTNLQSRLLEQELNKLSIPVTVYGGFRFFERQEVKHVLAYMDLVCSFDRDVSFARVINFPQRGIGERTVEDLRQEAKSNLMPMMAMIAKREETVASMSAGAAKKQAALASFAEMMIELAEAAQTVKLSELVQEIVEKTGIEAHYQAEASEAGAKKKGDAAKSEAEERLANINELISAARQFELDNPHLTTAAEILPEYLCFVQLMTSTSEADMDKKNTVSLMTVHSSKGLEFDHVFIAGAEDGVFPHARAIKEDEAAGHGTPSIEDADAAWLDATMAGNGEAADFSANAPEATDVPVADGPGVQEERRLMYVAMTRARKSLKITHAAMRMVGGEEIASEPSRFLLEIPRERCQLINAAEEALKPSHETRERGHDGQQPRRSATGSSFSLGNKMGAQRAPGQGPRTGGLFARQEAATQRHAPLGGSREYGGDAFDDTREAAPSGGNWRSGRAAGHSQAAPQAAPKKFGASQVAQTTHAAEGRKQAGSFMRRPTSNLPSAQVAQAAAQSNPVASAKAASRTSTAADVAADDQGTKGSGMRRFMAR